MYAILRVTVELAELYRKIGARLHVFDTSGMTLREQRECPYGEAERVRVLMQEKGLLMYETPTSGMRSRKTRFLFLILRFLSGMRGLF